MKKGAFSRDGLPKVFMDRFGQHVTGFISGFDRLRFRATLRPLFEPGGIEIYLNSCKVLIKDFARFASSLTERIRTEAYERFRQWDRPIQYVNEPSLSTRRFGWRLGQKARHYHRPNLFTGLRRTLPNLPIAQRSLKQANPLGARTFPVHPSVSVVPASELWSVTCPGADLVSFQC